jgi:hypothetical protein
MPLKLYLRSVTERRKQQQQTQKRFYCCRGTYFSSRAFWRLIQLKGFSILYGSQNTTLFTFYFYDKLFHIKRYFLHVRSI